MSETLLRLGLVLGVLALGLAVGVWRRAEAGRQRASTRESVLLPGVYLFTSRDCVDCVAARRDLEVLRGAGFIEVEWDDSPSTFAALGVDIVPTTVIVDADGSAALHPGVPAVELARLNP
jgi:hypothetical protein